MSSLVLSGLCLVALALYAVCDDDTPFNPCTGMEDGETLSVTCTEITNCTKGAPAKFPCANGTVVERDSLTCTPIGKGNTSCGTNGTCTGDGLRASHNCQSFYQCRNGTFTAVDHIYCPHNLLFDGKGCKYPENVTCNAA